MTQLLHTPGPWELTTTDVRNTVRTDPMNSYAFSLSDTANARLIAAAPELLEALMSVLPIVEDAVEWEGYKKDRMQKYLDMVRAAIKKADPHAGL